MPWQGTMRIWESTRSSVFLKLKKYLWLRTRGPCLGGRRERKLWSSPVLFQHFMTRQYFHNHLILFIDWLVSWMEALGALKNGAFCWRRDSNFPWDGVGTGLWWKSWGAFNLTLFVVSPPSQRHISCNVVVTNFLFCFVLHFTLEAF